MEYVRLRRISNLVRLDEEKERKGGREGGRESEGRGRVRFTLSLFFLEGGFLPGIYCFLFLFFWSPDIFWGSWYVSSTSPISSFSRVIVMMRASRHHNPRLEVKIK